jgi:hypothetical protein
VSGAVENVLAVHRSTASAFRPELGSTRVAA